MSGYLRPNTIKDNAPARRYWLLVGVTLLGALLALHGLGEKSLWLDEILGLRISSLHFTEIFVAAPGSHAKTPLHFLLVHFALKLGPAEFTSRLPSVFAAILAVPLIWRTGERLFGSLEGAVAGLLLAISPFSVHYAQETRTYAMMMLFSFLSLFCLYRAVTENSARMWLSYGLAALTAYYVDYLSAVHLLAAALFIAGLALARDPAINRRLILRAAIVGAVLLVFTIPATPPLWRLGSNYRWDTDIAGLKTPARISELALTYLDFLKQNLPVAAARYSADAPWLYLPAFLLGAVASWRNYRVQLFLTMLWIIVPLGLLYLSFMLVLGWVAPRYSVCALPAFLLLVARGIVSAARLGQSAIGRIAGATRNETAALTGCLILFTSPFVAANVPALAHYYRYDKQVGRQVAKYMAENRLPGDTAILGQALWEETTYYLPDWLIPYPGETLPLLQALCQEDGRRVWYYKGSGALPEDEQVVAWADANMEKVQSFQILYDGQVWLYRCGPTSRQAIERQVQQLRGNIAANADDGAAPFELANALSTLGDWPGAVAAYEKALHASQGKGGQVAILRGLGKAHAQLGQWAEAVNAFGQALKQDGRAPGVARDMAEAYRHYLDEHELESPLNLVSGLNAPSTGDEARAFPDPQVSHSGRPSLALQGLERGQHGGWWGTYELGCNRPYLYSAYVRAEDQGFIIGYLKGELLYRQNADRSLQEGQPFEGSMDWTPFSTVFYLPCRQDSPTQAMTIIPARIRGQGIAWVDEVQLIPLPLAVPRQ